MKKSIQDAITDAVAVLQEAGISEARMDAASLLMHLLSVDRAYLIAHADRGLHDQEATAFQRLVARRAAREPLQYIVRYQEFFKLRFEVGPGVLIPRPETELIVEAALGLADQQRAVSILDVGTGSGAIVVSLLHELTQARAVATDISAEALKVAYINARRHHVRDRLALVQSDKLSALNEREAFSLIVSNPPYVPVGDIETLPPEVRDHEPLSALISGADGLDHIRALLRDAPRLLQADGYFIFEMGFGQRDAVEQLVDQSVWYLIEVRRDLQNIPRTVVLQRR